MLLPFVAKGQYRTSVTVTDFDNAYLKTKIETNLSALISEFNYACAANRSLNFGGVNIDENAKKSVEMLWRNSPFRCDETEIVESAARLYSCNEYEIRNIPFVFTKFADSDNFREVAVTFDYSGKIKSFNITLPQNVYEPIFEENNEVTDMRRRQIVLDYVEQFRTAYDTKDIDFMEKVFSDDALIIVGRVVKTVKTDSYLPSTAKIEYLKKSKQQYLNDLRRVFQYNKRIHVDFQDVKVLRHPAKDGWYGVQLKQNYSSDRYNDEGYLFLLWDFTAGDDRPQIHVRVWQPDKIEGRPINEDEIFSMEDVNIY